MSKRAIVIVIGLFLATLTAKQWAESPESADESAETRKAKRVVKQKGTEPSRPGRPPFERQFRRREPRVRLPQPTADQEKELLAALKKWHPHRHQRLIELKKSRPRLYRRYVAAAWRWYLHWRDLPENVKKAAVVKHDTHMKIWKVLREIRSADSEHRKSELTTKLRKLVAKSFDAEQIERQYRLKELRKRLERLRAEQKQRLKNREKIINSRVKRLLSGKRPHAKPPKQDDRRKGPPPQGSQGPETDR